ncbi:MAG: PEP-CTERM sorting domain-containing protein [Crocosphaera sp.]
MKFIKVAKILAVSSAVISIGGIAEAATVSGGSGTYNLGAELLELEFTVDSIIDGDTPAGIRTVAFDFDGGTNPFRATTTLLSSSVPGAFILDVESDGILIDLISPIVTGPTTFTFLFGDIDTSSIDVGTNKSVDLRFNTGDANNSTDFQDPDFFRSGPDNLFAVQAESVPEPASIIGLLSIGTLGLGLKGKKKG